MILLTLAKGRNAYNVYDNNPTLVIFEAAANKEFYCKCDKLVSFENGKSFAMQYLTSQPQSQSFYEHTSMRIYSICEVL